MNISSLSIRRPIMAMVMSIVIVLFGVIGYEFLGVREYPSLDPPVITVRTSYAGANSDIIESQITEPLEKSINGIDGIRTISSASSLGMSNITVEFNLGKDMEAAANDVRDKVSQALRLLPQDIDAPPTVTKSDANSDAILTMTVQSNTRNLLEVNDYATNVIAERLQTIPGVSTIQIWGEKKYAMRLWLDPPKLASYGLTPTDVSNALHRENVDLPGGKIVGDATELTVRTYGRLQTPEDFNKLVILSDNTKTIRLSDVGYAEMGPENTETIMKQGGIPMVGLGIIPQPGSNYIEISDEFNKRFEQLKKEVPKDYMLNIALDNTRFVRQSVAEVGETLLIAILLVVIIIYLFFREWIIAFRPLIDIPVSLIGAFFIMYVAGFSINILTLLAIVLATGLVVDDGIVVTENIFKKLEAGMSPFEAADEGSKEIFFAVLSTSLTLAIVFLPIIFLQGFVGRLFREFGIVLGGAVLISAFVSLTLTPVLNVLLAKKDHQPSWFYRKSEPFYQNLTQGYHNLLDRFLKHRQWSFVIILASLAMIYIIGSALQSELAPLEDRSLIRVTATLPEGTSYDYTQAYMDGLSQFIQDSVPEKKTMLTITAPGYTGSGSVNTGVMRIRLSLPEERKRTQQQVADYVSKNLKRYPEARVFVTQEQTIGVGGSARSGLPVQYVIQAPNFEKLKAVLPKFIEEAQKDKTFQAVDWNLKFNKPEISVSIDREKANAVGVSVQDIANTLQLAYSGGRLDYFTINGKQYSVIGQADRENRDKPLDLKSLFVRNRSGKLVQLDNLVNTQEQINPPVLYHFNRYKSATISASLAPGKTIGDGIVAMQKIGKKVLNDNFSNSLSGPSRDFADSSSNILFAFVLALVLVYLILAAQFESWRDPLIIMFTVPLALSTALFSLWYFNQTLNIFSEIGIILLIGLVTKNGILIVEFANQQKKRGLHRREAALEAASLRLRPILMTSIATALGALPIALGLGAGAQSRIPMGIVVIGGLLLSLIFTLFVIPAMYTYLSKPTKA
ncbi:MAG: efflux RND transporter permease subunit [Bacteroidota bacterium]